MFNPQMIKAILMAMGIKNPEEYALQMLDYWISALIDYVDQNIDKFLENLYLYLEKHPDKAEKIYKLFVNGEKLVEEWRRRREGE